MWVDDAISKIKRRIARTAIQEVAQAYQSMAVNEAYNTGEEPGYRRLTRYGNEYLNPLDQIKLLQIVRYLYYNNAVGRRLVEIPVDFGYRVSVKAGPYAHPDLQKVMDRFWMDPYNNMPMFIGQLFERFALEGELLLPNQVNQQNGAVKLMFVEPKDIMKLECFADDQRYVDTIEMNGTSGEKGKTYKVVRYYTDPTASIKIGEAELGNEREVNASGFRMGNAFYFRQCHLITGRGRSPLEPVIDYIDAHDHAFFDQLRAAALQSAFVWDVTLNGASDAAVQEKIQKLHLEGPPKPGTVRVHNESEVWAAVTPGLNPDIVDTLLQQVRKIIGMGMALSETWVAAADDVNRSTAEVSDTPPHRHLERGQHMEQYIVSEIMNFVIDQAILYGSLRGLDPNDQEAREFKVEMPDLTTKDNSQTATALQSLGTAMSLAIQNGLADKETGRSLFYQIAGMEQPKDLDKRVEEEQKEKQEQDYDRMKMQAELAPKPMAGGPNGASKSPVKSK